MFRAVPPAPNTPVSAAPPSAACPVGTRRFAQAVAMLRPRWNRRVGNRGNVRRNAPWIQMNDIRKAAAWCAWICVCGCSEPADRRANTISRDSAGIEVVEAGSPTWDADRGWYLEALPSLSIGREEGDPDYLFNRIRGVRRLADGRIVLADGGSSQIRFFDPSGVHLKTVGGAGGGPGEFRFIGSMWSYAADSLVVTDLAGISFMDSQGTFARRPVVELAQKQHRGNPVGQVIEGPLLVVSGTRGFSPADAGTVIRDSLRFFWYHPSGSFGGPLVVLPSAERWGLQVGGVTSFPYVPFSPNPIWTVAGDRFYIGAGRRPEVAIWRPDGSLERLLRWPKAERPVKEALKEQLRTFTLESAEDANERRREERFLAETPIAERLPSYQSMLVDEEGNLWLEEYRPFWELESSWDVLTSGGQWLGAVSMAARFTPYQIGAHFVLGVTRDEVGVERVESFALVKDARGRSPSK